MKQPPNFFLWGICVFLLLIKTVTNVQNGPMLLYSTKNDIRFLNTTRNKLKPSILITNLTDGSALDYYYEQEKICWSDYALESIQCIDFNSTAMQNKVEVLITGVPAPDGIACDWFTSNLYWTESTTNRIEVVSIKTLHRKVLFWTDLDQPRAIALDPMQGLMFWTDWGEIPKIEKAGMDGDPHTRQIIVQDHIYWPNGLTLDFDNKHVYWIDGKLLFLKRMDYNGENIATIISGLLYPFAVAHYHSKFYWSDWNNWSIYTYDQNGTNGKNSSKEVTELLHSDVVPMDIHVWDPIKQPYRHNGCENNNGGCSHLCLLSLKAPGYTCACPTGINLIDNLTCAEKPQEMLLFARRTEMCLIYLDTPDYTVRVLNLTNMKFSIAVDYDPIDDLIYWTDTNVKKIQKARLDGAEQNDVLSFEIDSPDGIAIDWVARNVYWTDTGLDRIEVATLNGQHRRVIIFDGLLNPRAIAVAPNLGWLFWSDWHNKARKIERSHMDGSDRRVIISEDLGWANGIALDLDKLKIYWCDAEKDRIEFSNMDGTDRQILVRENLPHAFGLTLMGDYLYWTDWQRRSISRVHKETGGSRDTITDQIPNIMGLKAINTNRVLNETNNPCALNNGGCSQICLYMHDRSYKCVCQIMQELLSDNRTCATPEAFLLYTKKNGVYRVSVENKNNNVQLPISGILNASSVDYDKNNMRIYWSDVKTRTIMRAYINGSDPQKVVELGLLTPEGLTVDWVALNIYWSDPAAHKIEVARLDGSSRRVLQWENFREPHHITLDPQEGYMYWTEYTTVSTPTNSIIKAHMDGSNAQILVANTGFATGIAIDYDKRKIFWSESSSGAIYYTNLYGGSREVLFKNEGLRPVGLTLYEDHVYWLDELPSGKGAISKANKLVANDRTKVASLDESATDLLVISKNLQKEASNQCGTNNGGCSHLCLAVPPQNPNESTNYKCACPTHYILQSNTCIPPKRFMIYSQKNLTVRLVFDTSECQESVLPIQGLKNVKAIDFDPILQFLYWIEGKTVNGKTHSIKRAKAIGTHVSVVIPAQQNMDPYDIALDPVGRLLFWSCTVQDVINVTRVDNSSNSGVVVKVKDEKPRLIALHPTKRLLIYTETKEDQVIRTRMDGSQRIVLARDVHVTAIAVDTEGYMVFWAQGASIHSSNLEGEQHELVYKEEKRKINQLAVHSGWLYWYDKENLKRLELQKGRHSQDVVINRNLDMTDLISVMEPHKDNLCMQGHAQRCSHICIDNGTSAACACPHGLVLQDDRRSCATVVDCSPDFFACGLQTPGKKDCIPISWKCDGMSDCQDGSDESSSQCPACQPDQFKCHDGECIEASFECDHVPQCKDKSDEENCCKDKEFRCPRTDVCIPISNLCDGHEHCANGEDEQQSVCQYKSSGLVRLSSVFLWGFMSTFTLFIIIIAYYYIKRSMFNNNVTSPDQSEDPLNPIQNRGQIKAQKLRNKGIPDVVRMSMLNGSKTSTYDRDNITGASSSTNESSVACYPRETLNPPPSPATTAASTRASSPSAKYRPYKHYRTINQPPPPTPCSTDICDESDYNYPTHSQGRYEDRNRYDLVPFPPPPTPRSHCNSESCPPSPSSRSSTYFSPLPPPPSPVASPIRSYDS